MSYLDTFLVCAVASWLGVRLLLGLSGNPQVGGGGIHVAHMLWGGALMVTGIIINFLYLGRYGQRLIAILTGLGFGLFVDELGKFITSNNDYFYKPAVPIIYTIFVFLYLIFRLPARNVNASDREHLVNAVNALQEAVIREMDQTSLDRAAHHLAGATGRDEVTKALTALLEGIHGTSAPPNRARELVASIERFYVRLIRSVWFLRVAAGIFLIVTLVSVVSDIQGTLSLLGVGPPTRVPGSHEVVTFSDATGLIVSTIADAVSDVLVFAGAILLFRSRLMAYHLWELAILIDLLLGGMVAFYYIQYQFVASFIVGVVAIVVLNGLIREERRRHARRVEFHVHPRASHPNNPPRRANQTTQS